MAELEFLYDVALSFLGEDEPLARQIGDVLRDRLSVFIYSNAEQQTKLAGRDGEEAFGKVLDTSPAQ